MTDLAGLLRAAAAGRPPAADGGLTVLRPPDERSAGVFAFTAHHVVCADVDPLWVKQVLPPDDLSAPLNPPFLTELAVQTGRHVNGIDVVLAAAGTGRRTGLLADSGDPEHPRASVHHRVDRRLWTVDGGFALLGRGVAGRYEVAVEVAPAARGRGLGAALFAALLGEVPAGEPVWAQVAPGNVASLRAVLAAGFRPVGAEAVLV